MSKLLELTLLPGLDGTGELFAPLQAALGGRFASRAVRYDVEQSLDDYVTTVARGMPEENAILVAESFSGLVALALMGKHPGRVKCAVLCATFAESPFRSLLSAARHLPVRMFTSNYLQRLLLRGFCLNGEGENALLEHAVAVLRSVPAATMRRRLQVLADSDATPVLAHIEVPVLYLQAMQDRVVRPRHGRSLAERLPCVKVQEVEGPHLLLQSRPVQCAAAITRFVADHTTL